MLAGSMIHALRCRKVLAGAPYLYTGQGGAALVESEPNHLNNLLALFSKPHASFGFKQGKDTLAMVSTMMLLEMSNVAQC